MTNIIQNFINLEITHFDNFHQIIKIFQFLFLFIIFQLLIFQSHLQAWSNCFLFILLLPKIYQLILIRIVFISEIHLFIINFFHINYSEDLLKFLLVFLQIFLKY